MQGYFSYIISAMVAAYEPQSGPQSTLRVYQVFGSPKQLHIQDKYWSEATASSLVIIR